MALILVVDDEASVRRVLARWIAAEGHEVREAGSADKAVADMAAHPSDVVFSDIQMPGRNGLWLTAELRKRHPDAAVVLATAASTVPPRFSLQAGVLAYLVKPFNQSSVINALELALHWHRNATPSTRIAPEDLQAWLESLL